MRYWKDKEFQPVPLFRFLDYWEKLSAGPSAPPCRRSGFQRSLLFPHYPGKIKGTVLLLLSQCPSSVTEGRVPGPVLQGSHENWISGHINGPRMLLGPRAAVPPFCSPVCALRVCSQHLGISPRKLNLLCCIALRGHAPALSRNGGPDSFWQTSSSSETLRCGWVFK